MVALRIYRGSRVIITPIIIIIQEGFLVQFLEHLMNWGSMNLLPKSCVPSCDYFVGLIREHQLKFLLKLEIERKHVNMNITHNKYKEIKSIISSAEKKLNVQQ